MSHPLPFNPYPSGTAPAMAKNYHRCPAPGCRLVVPNRLLACAAHTSMLPRDIREELDRHYQPGRTIQLQPEPWRAAYGQAVAVWELAAGKAAKARGGE